MKLKIDGDYVKGFLEFIPCKIIIEFGKIQSVKCNDRQYFYDYFPSYNSEYKIEKIYYDKYLKNHKHTYRILYQNEKNEVKTINIKPNQFLVFQTKWAFKKYLIQSDDFKKDVLKYFIGLIFGIICTITTKEVIRRYKAEPDMQPKVEIQKPTL